MIGYLIALAAIMVIWIYAEGKVIQQRNKIWKKYGDNHKIESIDYREETEEKSIKNGCIILGIVLSSLWGVTWYFKAKELAILLMISGIINIAITYSKYSADKKELENKN